MPALYDAMPVSAQNLACTLAGWQRSRARFTPHFHARLAELEQSARLSLPALRQLQWEKLRNLWEHARRHVPAWSGLPAPSTAEEPALAIAETLGTLPPLEKRSYRDRPRDYLARNLDERQLILGKTSGTTGSALPLWYTREALAEEFATIWRGRRSAGAELDAPNLTFNGQLVVPFRQGVPPFWRRNRWNRQTLFSLHHCTQENLRHYVEAIHETPATFAQGYPSGMYLVARALLEAERPLPPGRLRACFSSSESLLAYQRETIEAGFGAPVVDRYGVSELCVSMTECPQRRLHVDMEYGVVELEVSEEGDDWERGSLLVTGFANPATPLLRYRVGDVGTRSKQPCPCGRAGEVFLDVDGRIEDYVETPDGRLVGRLDHIFKEQLDVAEAQVLQETPASLEVLLVRRPEFDATSERKLLQEFRARLGEEIGIEFRYVDSIPREANGKLRAVKSAVGGAR